MDITKLLLQSLGNGGLEQLGQQVGLDKSQTNSAVGAMIPTLLSALARNSATPEGASGLLGALDRDHDGGILEDVAGFLGNSESMNGNGILKHVLGNERQQVEQGIAGKLGVNAGSIAKLLPIVAPMVMAYLGKERRSTANTNLNSADGLSDLLGSLAGNSRQNDGLDIGDILNVVGALSGKGGSSSGAGGLLGGLLKNVLKG